MPEISSTMYPIVGAAAIAILLLLVVATRRRRASRDRPDAEHEAGPPATEDESLGVRLIKDDHDAPPEGDIATQGRGDATVVPNGAHDSPAAARAGGASSSEAARARPPGSGSGSLVAWGPDESGPEQPRGKSAPAAGGTGAEASARLAVPQTTGGDPVSGSPPEAENQPESHAGPESPPADLPPADGGEPSPTGAGHPEEDSAVPEGQPFERAGSWWFRRDGELLVYDDATGEWKAAPEAGSGAPATGVPVTAANLDEAAHGGAPQATTTATLERGASHPHEGPLRPRSEGATSWKCRTCGATNGSAASGCRMCFSARP